MIPVLKIAALSEALTGLGLVVSPSLLFGLIFGATVEGTGIIAGRLAGLALIGLGLACWPGTTGRSAPLGLMVYSLAAAIYLAVLGIGGQAKGILLWPAVAAHGVITLLLLRTWRGTTKPI